MLQRKQIRNRLFAILAAASVLGTAAPLAIPVSAASQDISNTMSWDPVRIGGGGFVSGIVTGQNAMYARTDVGGAYRYNYQTDSWEQLFGFLNEAERGFLSVDAMAIDPTDDDTVYFLCGCAYFSDARTVIFKTTDGGDTFTQVDVTDMIQVHGNGNGRQTGESIAVDPDNPNIIYAGGDVTAGDSALIKSTDGGKTWKPVMSYDALGLFDSTTKWPTWTDHVARCLDAGEYNTQNGVCSIYIYDGKVYVGASTTGQYSMVVADVADDEFTDLSSKLSSDTYPARITGDGQGNLYFAYQGTVVVGNGGSAGGIFKYNTQTGAVTDISPVIGGFSEAHVDPSNPNRIVTSTCGLWYSQMWQEWDDEHGPAWGDRFFKSEDGGATWTEMTPGNTAGWNQPLISEYLQDGGYAWIRDKAIHWVGSIVIDPANPDRIHITSGNGVFSCDNTWADVPQFYFHPDGIEEVVALDMVSVPGGAAYSAIGDYDGFIHTDATEIPTQYQPNIGSTSGIAYCPSNPKIMARVGQNDAKGYYSKDGGSTWTEMNFAYSGGKIAITELTDGSYRIINSSSSGSALSYSDDFGGSWTACSGINGSKQTYPMVDLNDPSIVYASGVKHNDYWASDPTKTEPTLEESHYSFYISQDYGATFTETVVSRYDMCDHTGDMAYVTDDTIAMAVGWYGMYLITEQGTNIEKTDVFYAKTVGYGAPEKAGGVNTLYIYGKPTEADVEGIYRSTDMGKTWVCINTDSLYGGTGNGNFLVGDMNTFGTVYLSTVGCGIIRGYLSDAQTEIPTADWGDVDCNGTVAVADLVLLNRYIAEDNSITVSEQGLENAKVTGNASLSSTDALKIMRFLANLITEEELAP